MSYQPQMGAIAWAIADLLALAVTADRDLNTADEALYETLCAMHTVDEVMAAIRTRICIRQCQRY